MRRVLLVAGGVLGLVAVAGGGFAGYTYYIQTVEAAPLAASSNGGSVALASGGSVSNSNDSVPLNTSTTGAASSGIAINSQNTAENTRQSSQSSDNSSNNSSSGSSAAAVPSATELKSYLQYLDSKNAMFGELLVGTGPEAKAGSKVTINYRGWLTTGQLFDDSYQRGKPLVFTLGQHQVVLGMEEGVFGMKVGGKRRIIIPPSVGYGTEAHDPIPANSIMVFDVELVGSE